MENLSLENLLLEPSQKNFSLENFSVENFSVENLSLQEPFTGIHWKKYHRERIDQLGVQTRKSRPASGLEAHADVLYWIINLNALKMVNYLVANALRWMIDWRQDLWMAFDRYEGAGHFAWTLSWCHDKHTKARESRHMRSTCYEIGI